MLSSSSSSSISTSLERLRTGLVNPPVEIIWSSHPLWPLSPNPNHSNTSEIRISVLDSSFNPPTLAHLALANATAPTPSTSTSTSTSNNPQLLLLSVRNADKQPKSSDASYTQRLQMMIELAKDIHDYHDHTPEANHNNPHPGIAVAIIDEPTFVRKSKLLRSFFSERLHARLPSSSPSSSPPPSPLPPIRLTFILGYDTLERLFDPKYYNSSPEHMYSALRAFFAHNTNDHIDGGSGSGSGDRDDSGDGDGSLVICARRSPSSYPHPSLPPPPDSPSSSSLTNTISTFLTSSNLPSSSVSIIDIGEDLWSISSSQVRDGVKTGRSDWSNSVTDRVRRYIVEHGLYK